MCITIVITTLSAIIWGLGVINDWSWWRLAGLMLFGGTFVPVPADILVLNEAATKSAVWLALVSTTFGTAGVLLERLWLQRAFSLPILRPIQRFIGTTRYLNLIDQNMTLAVFFGAFSPVPFEVFRFTAVARNFNVWMYAGATFAGRGARYYLLARAGSELSKSGLLPATLILLGVLFVIGVINSVRRVLRKAPSQPAADLEVELEP